MNTVANGRELQQLSAVILNRYGIRVRAIVTMRTVFGVLAVDGRQFIWKWLREHDHAPRLYSVAEVSRVLQNVGIEAAGPVRNLAGDLLTIVDGERVGYLQSWLKGRHVDVTDRQERLSAIATIGTMHAKSRTLPLHLWAPLSGVTLFGKLQVKHQTLQNIWVEAQTNYPGLIRVEEPTFAAIESSIRALSYRSDGMMSPRYVSIPLQSLSAFCHRDLAPHNMLWQNRSRPVALIDFDHSGVDDPFIDVMQILNHTLFLSRCRRGDFLDIVNTYHRVCPLTGDREQVLWQLFRFPDVLVRATAEWVKTGCRPERRGRINAAIQKENLRSQIWEHDYRSRFGNGY